MARERPLLEELLDGAPDRSVLDLGCGTGEHVAFFASLGARAVGLDRSASMIEAANDHAVQGSCRFIQGDALDARTALGTEPPFGLAICLGNMLPHVLEDADLDRFASSARACLAAGGSLLTQSLNYQRIEAAGVRHLPVNVRPGDDGREIVFLRLMSPAASGRILFFPTTLELDPSADEPVVVKGSRRVELRAWTAGELTRAFTGAGFDVAVHGDMQRGGFDPATSHDVVIVATASR